MSRRPSAAGSAAAGPECERLYRLAARVAIGLLPEDRVSPRRVRISDRATAAGTLRSRRTVLDQVEDPLADPVAGIGQGIGVPQAGAAVVGLLAEDLPDRVDELVGDSRRRETARRAGGTRGSPSRRSAGPSPSRP